MNELPQINRSSARISTLERRLDHLQNQLERKEYEQGFNPVQKRDYITAEVKALEDALRALKYHRAVVEHLDHPLALVRELAALEVGGKDWLAQLEKLQVRAVELLEEFRGYGDEPNG